jgi:hypothetical protein
MGGGREVRKKAGKKKGDVRWWCRSGLLLSVAAAVPVVGCKQTGWDDVAGSSPNTAVWDAPAELLLVPAGLLQLPARQTLRVHLARALAGADHVVAAILRRLLQADPAHVAL